MNICFVSFDYPSDTGGGGVGNQVQLLARSLVQEGHCVSVVALARPDLPDFSNDNGVSVHRVRVGNWHWYIGKLPLIGKYFVLVVRELEYAWSAYRNVRKLHKQSAIDVIEGTETGGLWIALFLRDAPLVIRLHGERYTFHKYTPNLPLTPGLVLARSLQRMAILRARILISPSLAHASEIDAELAGHHPPISVIPNFTDSKVLFDLKRNMVDGEFVVFAGRLEDGKGLSVFLEAIGGVICKYPTIQFVLAGALHPTMSMKKITNMLDEFGIKDNVRLLGHVPWGELVALYQQALVAVLPSYYETFGVSALEAMAMGVPVVATNTGGLPEVVLDGATGVLVPPGNPRELANAITRLLNNPDERDRMGARAKERVREFFDVDRATERNLAVYHQVINR